MSNMINLREVNFSGNKLKVLPESISETLRLKSNDISGNQLESLPESFGAVQLQRDRMSDKSGKVVDKKGVKRLTKGVSNKKCVAGSFLVKFGHIWPK